jgi:hypothetical protein
MLRRFLGAGTLTIVFIFSFFLQAQVRPSPPPVSLPPIPTTQPMPAGEASALGWRIIKQKWFPFYYVQILTKDNPAVPLGIEGTRAVIMDLNGKVLAEIKNLLIEPDPRETIEGWIPGMFLDVDRDGYEDLVLRTFTGGNHCCYSYQIYSLGKVLKKIADLKLNDCGEKIKLQDLNGDGRWEIISCNAGFIYFQGLSYDMSPFPPMIFGFEAGKFVNQDKKYPKIFDDDIAAEKKELQEKGYSDSNVLQITLDYFLSGREAEGWQQFDQLCTSAKKELIRQQLREKWEKFQGLHSESGPAETRFSETLPKQ